jgi:two-component system cell cycle sensor histidine kinase/response regulator CckA
MGHWLTVQNQQSQAHFAEQHQAEISALLEGSRAILEYREFADTARAILHSCQSLIGATAGYVALLAEDGTEKEVLFLDPDGLLYPVDPRLPTSTRGLRGEACRTGKAVYHNDFANSEWAKFMPGGRPALDSVLFAPLVIEGKAVGLLGIVNKPGGFTENDARLAAAFGELAAIALRSSQALESLETSEEWFRSVVQTASDAIITADSRGNIVLWNQAAETIFGYSADEAIGKPFTLIIPEQFREAHQKGVPRAVSTGQSSVSGKMVEMVGLRKDGNEFPLELSLATWKTREGAFLTVTIHDITKRKHLEDQLRQSQRMEAIGRLAGGVAHDFNNLLTTIIGYSDILLKCLNGQDPLREDVEEIGRAAKRAASLTRQLLAFSRKQVLQPQSLDLNVLVSDVDKMLHRIIGEDIELVNDLDPGLGRVKADPGQVEQIIMNLAINARDAMPQGGRLTIKTENVTLDEDYYQIIPGARPGRFVCLSVTDTGVGMTKETLQHIFEPFFSTKENGTGLGLAVAYGIVKQHEGWINVYSEPGHGSTFRVYLPAFAVEPGEERVEAIPLQELQGRGEWILLVEDEAAVRELVARSLGENGYVVFKAASAQEALEIFARERGKFHLIFSDVVLPDGTGLQLADQFLPRNPELRVLLSSGYTAQKSQWPLISERGFRFLQKPYTLADLLRALRAAVDTDYSGDQASQRR